MGVEGLESLTSDSLNIQKPKHPLVTKRNGKHEATQSYRVTQSTDVS